MLLELFLLEEKLGIKFMMDVTGFHHGQTDFILYAYIEEGGKKKVAGRVECSDYQGECYINWIKVENEFLHKGVAEALIKYLITKENYKYSDLNWGMTTPEGTKLKKNMDRKFKR